MDELVSRVLSDWYGFEVHRLDVLNASSLENGQSVYQMYRVEPMTGPPLLLFAYHDDFVDGPTFHWSSNQPLAMWLGQRADLLIYLAAQGYPAPQVRLSRINTATTVDQEWNFLAVTYIEGETNNLSLENMVLMGEALGRLHELPLPVQGLGCSWWNVTYSIPHALALLTEATVSLASSSKAFAYTMATLLQFMQQHLPLLPERIIHGDCWAPNAVTQAHGVVLTWERCF